MSEALQQRLLAPETTDQWLWIVIVSSFGTLLTAFGIGANDAANAFATSIGSKTLTLKQAVVLAGIFELMGAILLGKHVVSAYREAVIDLSCFVDNPGMLMYGSMCIMYTTGMWLVLASYLELPVSTAHSSMGAVIGMVVAYDGGKNCIVWFEETDTFPFCRGICAILASWLISPLFAGLVASLLFVITRKVVLRHAKAFPRSFWVFPLFIMCSIATNVVFFIYRGPKSLGLDATSGTAAALWSFGLGVGVALILVPTALPAMRNNVLRLYNEDGTKKGYADDIGAEVEEGAGAAGSGAVAFVRRQLEHNVHASVEGSREVAAIHANAENFDPRVEEVFKYVQVVSAICDAFAHGANDVAVATVPLELVYSIYLEGEVTSRGLGDRTYGILIVGGLGMIAGVAVYGHKVIETIGVKLAKITPSRGYCVEMGAALTLIIGTKLELPQSSTHCQVGATTGVALMEGIGGLNVALLKRIAIGWVATVFICAFSCALLFSQGAYAPYMYETNEEVNSST